MRQCQLIGRGQVGEVQTWGKTGVGWRIRGLHFIRLLPTAPVTGPTMLAKVARVRETLPTLIALKWLVASVNPEMHCQVAGTSKSSSTHGAEVWFVSCVAAHVSRQAVGEGKLLVALGALKWFVPSVRAFMFGQIAG